MNNFNEKLPSGWITVSLQDLVTSKGVFSDGDWIESKDQDPHGNVRLIQLADIGELKFLDKSKRYLTNEKAVELKCLFLKKGDVLISRLGEPLGKACIYPGRDEKAITAVDICVFRPETSYIDSKLITYFLNSPRIRNLINNQSSGTTRKRITGKKLKMLQFRLPSLNEQKRIVSKIEELFSSIDKAEAALKQTQKLLEQYKQSVLRAAVTGELTKNWREQHQDDLESGEGLLKRILKLQCEIVQSRSKYKEPQTFDISNLPELPHGWIWVSLERLVINSQNGLGKRNNIKGRLIDVLRLSNIVDNKIKSDNLRQILCDENEIERYILKPKDILCIRVNGSPDLVGKFIPYIYEHKEQLYCDHFIRLSPSCKSLSDYLCLFAMSQSAKDFIKSKIVSTAGQNTISQGSLLQMPIALPSEEEQKKIIDKVSRHFSQIAALENWSITGLKRSAKLRQSILKSAFSGQLVSQHPNDEPAEELLKKIKAGKETQQSKNKSKKLAKQGKTISEELTQ